MKLFITATVVLFSMFLFMSCAKQMPLVLNIEQEPIPASLDSKSYTPEIVQRAILSACRKKGWSANVVEQGKIVASITIRTRHRAKIEVSYTATHYSIRYIESSGLSYRNGHIHSNYNHWIAKLDAEIKKEFGLKTQRF